MSDSPSIPPGPERSSIVSQLMATKASTQLRGALLSPAVITVLITAVIGPWAVQRTAHSLESMKLRAELVKHVIQHTAEANFHDAHDIARARVLSQIVADNKDLFGLAFDSTSAAMMEMVELIRTNDQARLSARLSAQSDTIHLLQDAVDGYTDAVQIAQRDVERLQRRLDATNTQTAAERRQLADSIRFRQRQVDSLAVREAEARGRLSDLQAERKITDQKLAVASKEIEALRRANEQSARDLETATARLAEAGNDADKLRQEAEAANARLAQALEEARTWKMKYESEVGSVAGLLEREQHLTAEVDRLRQEIDRMERSTSEAAIAAKAVVEAAGN